MNHIELNFNIAELFIRCFLGILLIFQGYDKLFVVKIKNVVNAFHAESVKKNVPNFLVVLVSYFSSITEFFGGIFLITGLFHHYVPIVIALDLLIVSVAFSFINPIWDLKHVFPRVILVTALMLLSNYFYFGIDTLIFK
jgi:uncharacterized membrane protein YphA (DoxX/SURF4 family)